MSAGAASRRGPHAVRPPFAIHQNRTHKPTHAIPCVTKLDGRAPASGTRALQQWQVITHTSSASSPTRLDAANIIHTADIRFPSANRHPNAQFGTKKDPIQPGVGALMTGSLRENPKNNVNAHTRIERAPYVAMLPCAEISLYIIRSDAKLNSFY